MKDKKFSDSVRKVGANFDGLRTELFQIADLMDSTGRYNVRDQMMHLDRVAEVNTVELRNLTARLPDADVGLLYDEVASALAISVKEERQWIRITVPAILPKKLSRSSQTFMLRPMRHALMEFMRESPIERFGRCAVCIEHTYDEALGTKRVRDYDNIETKRYLDVIEAFFMTTDSGNSCTVLQTTTMSDRDATVFYIMPTQNLAKWVDGHV